MANLRLPEPYDFTLSTGRFRAFGPDLANLWHDGGLHRVVDGLERRIVAAPGGVDVEPLDERGERVLRKLLGEEHDLEGFTRFAAADPVLGPLAARAPGYRPPLAPDPFETLVTSVSAQQVSLHAAFAVRNRLIARFGERAELAYTFPTRERLAAASVDEVLACGFSRRKAATLVELARSDLDLDGLARLSDEEVKARVQAVRGLGEWTADWFLARHLARPAAWPAGDLGLRKAVSRFVLGGREASVEEVRALGARFRPYQNLAAHYLLLGWLLERR